MPVSALLLANFAREVFTDVLIALFYPRLCHSKYFRIHHGLSG